MYRESNVQKRLSDDCYAVVKSSTVGSKRHYQNFLWMNKANKSYWKLSSEITEKYANLSNFNKLMYTMIVKVTVLHSWITRKEKHESV